jgi:sec-independent protein translocase protein TatC
MTSPGRGMSFLEHLAELRKRLFRAAAGVLAAFLICFYFAKPLYLFLEHPIRPYLPAGHERLVFTELSAPFMAYVKVALFFAVIFSSPYVLAQIWGFLSPGLKDSEKRAAILFVAGGAAAFLSGAAFGYAVAVPRLCEFFLKMGSDFLPMLTVTSYLGLLMKVVLAMGLVFQMPVVSGVLARIGILTPAFLLHWWRQVIVGIFIAAALVTPTPDAATQMVFAVPMLILYLVSIAVAWAFQKRPE